MTTEPSSVGHSGSVVLKRDGSMLTVLGYSGSLTPLNIDESILCSLFVGGLLSLILEISADRSTGCVNVLCYPAHSWKASVDIMPTGGHETPPSPTGSEWLGGESFQP